MAVKGTTLAVSFAIFYILQVSDAAIVPVNENYTATVSNDFTITWTYDNEADMNTVDWTYQSSSSATPTTIMSKVGTAAAQVFNNYNVEHVNKGEIKLKTITMDNTGIYFCVVAYTLGSGHPEVTGTATLSVTAQKAQEAQEDSLPQAAIVAICLIVAFVCGLIVGIICVHLGVLGEQCKDIPVWVWILCLFEVGLGILIDWMIWDGGLNNGCRLRRIVGICFGVAFLGNHIATIIVVFIIRYEDVLWVWVLAPCIIGIGVMIVGLIWYCCIHDAGNGDVPPRNGMPNPETQSGNQHGGQQMSKKEKKKAKEAEAHVKNEQHDGKPHREQPPIPDRATGTPLHGRPMPAMPPEHGIQGKNNKIHDSKGRGLSANFDDNHLLVGIDTPSQRKGALKKINEDNL